MAQGDIRIPPEAIAALRQGQTIQAIKLLREATGLDLKQAKDVIEARIAGAAEALARGEVIEAIKRLRAANPQFDLKTAKELVERHRHGNRATAAAPTMQKRVPTVVEGDRGSNGWLWLVALAAIFALWYFFSGQG